MTENHSIHTSGGGLTNDADSTPPYLGKDQTIGVYLDMKSLCDGFPDDLKLLVMESKTEKVILSCNKYGTLSCERVPKASS